MSILRAAGRVLPGVALLATVVVAQSAPPARGAAAVPVPNMGSPASVFWPPQGMVPITDRMSPSTLQGTIVEISCFRSKGAATVAAPDQVACAKAAVAKNSGVVGILTEGDGLYKLVGPLTANNYAKLVPMIGQRVDMPGSEVILSNNFDYKAFDAKSMTAARK